MQKVICVKYVLTHQAIYPFAGRWIDKSKIKELRRISSYTIIRFIFSMSVSICVLLLTL